MIYALFIIGTFTGGLSTAFMKTYRQSVSGNKLGDGLYYTVNIFGALLFFAALCRFDLRVNLVTLLFAAVFACLCYLSVFLQLRALETASMVDVGLFSSGGRLILSALAGVLFFGESIGLKSVIGFLFTLASISVPYFAAKKSGVGLKGILFCCLLALNSGAVSVLMKLYHTVPDCLNENVFCFYTNVVMIPFVLYMNRRVFFNRDSYEGVGRHLVKPAIFALAAVLTANISTLLSMVIVGKVDLFFASVFGPPLTICINFLFDTFCFKDPVKPAKIISILLAIAAIIFTV